MIRGRLEAYRARRWAAYGNPVKLTKHAVAAIAHASSGPVSARLVMSHHRVLAARPAAGQLPIGLAAMIEALDDESQIWTWVVQQRPASGRTVIHEIGSRGQLVSVVKIGSAADAGLVREAAVLRALGGWGALSVAVPPLLGEASNDKHRAIRTAFEVPRPATPPYRWPLSHLQRIGQAITDLTEGLRASAADTDGGTGAAESSLAPAHGDMTPWNVILPDTEQAPALIIDLESVGFRPAGWDRASFVIEGIRKNHFGRRDIGAVAAPLGATPAQLRTYLQHSLTARSSSAGPDRMAQLAHYRRLSNEAAAWNWEIAKH